jgi:putative ABC transport system substrate-binding protein
MIVDPDEVSCRGRFPGREEPVLQRRKAIASLAALAAAPLVRAQAPRSMPRVAGLCFGSPGNLRTRVDAFVEGMRRLGYVDGRDVRYEFRYGNGQRDLLAGLARDIVAGKPDVIVCGSTLTTPPLIEATKTIPLVMVTAEEALVTARNPTRPAPNVTGTVNNALEQIPRSLQHAHAVVPGLTRFAALINPGNPAHVAYRSALEAAARNLRVAIEHIEARARSELDRAVDRAASTGQALVVMSDATLYDDRRAIVELAMVNRIPAMYPQRGYVEAGGLMSYGQNIEAGFARAANFVDRILKGAKPADLPLELPAKVEFTVNRYTAANLGLKIPEDVLKRADRVVG